MSGFSFTGLALPAVVVLAITATWLLTGRDWRWSVLALGLQYAAVFALTALHWPVELALVKMVAGWMAAAVLLAAMLAAPHSGQDVERFWPSGVVFRLLAAALVGLLVYSVAPQAAGVMVGLQEEQILGALALIGLGLLHLGLTAHPFRVAVGLLTALSGFEIFYAAVESSALVAGLLAAVHLGLALAAAYLLAAPEMEAD